MHVILMHCMTTSCRAIRTLRRVMLGYRHLFWQQLLKHALSLLDGCWKLLRRFLRTTGLTQSCTACCQTL